MILEPCCGCKTPVKYGSELYCEDCTKILNRILVEEGWDEMEYLIEEVQRNFWDGVGRTN